MTQVLIRHLPYEQDKIQRHVNDMLDTMGPDWISEDMHILIKPNLLLPASPEKAIVTHPMICRAVARYVLDRGAKVQVSDSPGMGQFARLIRETGYEEALQDLDVILKPFDASVEVNIGPPFGRIPIAKDAIEADRVINLAKLKTHAQMYLTLSIKNMFGCIVGLRKPEWHMRVGVDRLRFAQLLVQIYEAVNPDFTILDGILALQGQGPGKSGQPRPLGLLIGSDNGHAVDKTVCAILGLDPEQLLTLRQANQMNLCREGIHVNGDIDIIDDFVFPELHSLSMGPESVRQFMRKYVIQRPVLDTKTCKTCGECWHICPAKAIAHDVRGVRIDMNQCIRCYCCIEVCPHAAIHAQEPLLGRLRRRLVTKADKKQDVASDIHE